MSIFTPIEPSSGSPVRFGRLSALLGKFANGGSRLAERVSDEEVRGAWIDRLRSRTEEARREKDIRRLGSTLDQLSDRQLAVLGFSRDFLFSDLEDRYDAMLTRKEKVAALTDERGEAPKAITHAG
ncbi:MAG: hypothetical protein AAFU61_11020 [Pseudomonadota bacterium]